MNPTQVAHWAFVDTETLSLRDGSEQVWEFAAILADAHYPAEGSLAAIQLVVTDAVTMFLDVGPTALEHADPMSLRISRFYARHPQYRHPHPVSVPARAFDPAGIVEDGVQFGRYYRPGCPVPEDGAVWDAPTFRGFGNDDLVWDRHAAAAEVARLLFDRTVFGSVPSFDDLRLAQLCKRHGHCLSVDYHLMDDETMIAGWMAGKAAADRRIWVIPAAAVPPFSSTALNAAAGIPDIHPDVLHTAMGDAAHTLRCVATVYDLNVHGWRHDPPGRVPIDFGASALGFPFTSPTRLPSDQWETVEGVFEHGPDKPTDQWEYPAGPDPWAHNEPHPADLRAREQALADTMAAAAAAAPLRFERGDYVSWDDGYGLVLDVTPPKGDPTWVDVRVLLPAPIDRVRFLAGALGHGWGRGADVLRACEEAAIPAEREQDETPDRGDVGDLLYRAWTVIANAGGWVHQHHTGLPDATVSVQEASPGWAEAAIRWRDDYHRWLDAQPADLRRLVDRPTDDGYPNQAAQRMADPIIYPGQRVEWDDGRNDQGATIVRTGVLRERSGRWAAVTRLPDGAGVHVRLGRLRRANPPAARWTTDEPEPATEPDELIVSNRDGTTRVTGAEAIRTWSRGDTPLVIHNGAADPVDMRVGSDNAGQAPPSHYVMSDAERLVADEEDQAVSARQRADTMTRNAKAHRAIVGVDPGADPPTVTRLVPLGETPNLNRTGPVWPDYAAGVWRPWFQKVQDGFEDGSLESVQDVMNVTGLDAAGAEQLANVVLAEVDGQPVQITEVVFDPDAPTPPPGNPGRQTTPTADDRLTDQLDRAFEQVGIEFESGLDRGILVGRIAAVVEDQILDWRRLYETAQANVQAAHETIVAIGDIVDPLAGSLDIVGRVRDLKAAHDLLKSGDDRRRAGDAPEETDG